MKYENSISIKTVFITAGAFISYTIGAGFASGNEVLQFFGSWGFPESFLAIIGAVIVTLTYCVCLYRTGQSVSFEKTSDAYSFFGGKVLGSFFQIFVFVFILGCFMLMFSGAGSLLNQFLGIPQWIGAVALGVVTGVIVLGGLETVENVLGSAGLVILAYVMLFGIVALFHPAASIEQSVRATEAVAEGKIWQANLFELPPLGWIPNLEDFNSPFITGILYGALCVVSGFPFYLTLGRQMKGAKEATISGVVTAVSFYICVGCSLLIMLTNFNSLTNPATGEMQPFPVLAGVDAMWPAGSWTYVIIIFVGIFTTAAGYLWVLTDWFFPGQEKTKNTQRFILIMLIVGVSLGGVIPFSKLINFMFPLTGVAGVIMTITVLVKTIKGYEKATDEKVDTGVEG